MPGKLVSGQSVELVEPISPSRDAISANPMKLVIFIEQSRDDLCVTFNKQCRHLEQRSSIERTSSRNAFSLFQGFGGWHKIIRGLHERWRNGYHYKDFARRCLMMCNDALRGRNRENRMSRLPRVRVKIPLRRLIVLLH